MVDATLATIPPLSMRLGSGKIIEAIPVFGLAANKALDRSKRSGGCGCIEFTCSHSFNKAVIRQRGTGPLIEFQSQPRIVAEIVMLGTSEGGRTQCIQIDNDTRYMPHVVVDDRSNRTSKADANGNSCEHYMGIFFEPAQSMTDPSTGSGLYPLRLMHHPRVDYSLLVVGATFTVREGGRIVGHGVVVQHNAAMDNANAIVG